MDGPNSVILTPEITCVSAMEYNGRTGADCALDSSGTIWSWGDNYYGELGNDTTVSSPSIPVSVKGVPSTVQAIAHDYGGGMYAITSNSAALYMWGDYKYSLTNGNEQQFTQTSAEGVAPMGPGFQLP